MEQYKEINGIGYTLVGDYYLPNLLPPPSEDRPVGVWGRRRMEYLKNHHYAYFMELVMSGQLNTHLADTDERAQALFSRLVEQMAAQDGVTEELKAKDQMRWTGLMNNIAACAREIVYHEVVYV